MTDYATAMLGQINAIDFWARARWATSRLASDDGGKTLEMRAPKTGLCVRVTLDVASDTYVVRVCKVWRGKVTELGSVASVYASDLVRAVDAIRDAARAKGVRA